MRILSPALCVVALALLPAQASAFRLAQAGKPEEIETRTRRAITERTPGMDRPVRLSAELGTALTRGNTETFHLSSSTRLSWAFAERWVSDTRVRALYEESYGVVTANNWGAFQRVDRFLTERFATFGAAGVERDIFSGLDWRYSAQAGASYLLLERRDADLDDLVRDRLTVELGAYAAHEVFTLSPTAPPTATLAEADRQIYAGRAAASYVHTFRRGTSAGLEVEVIQDFNDTANFVTNQTAFVTAAIVEGLALKLSATHRYDALPASADLEKSDFLLTSGIVVSL